MPRFIPPPRDADAEAFFWATGITNGAYRQAVTQRARALKATGIWAKLFFDYLFVGGNSTAHSYSLINPATSRITWHGTITHNALGVQGDGTSGYGSFPFSAWGANPLGFYALYVNSHPNTAVNAYQLALCRNDHSAISLTYASQPTNFALNSTNRTFAASNGQKSSVMVNRPSSTTSLYVKNVVDTSNSVPGADSISAGTGFILNGSYDGAAPGGGFSTSIISGATAGQALTSADLANFEAIQQAFQAALGRQV